MPQESWSNIDHVPQQDARDRGFFYKDLLFGAPGVTPVTSGEAFATPRAIVRMVLVMECTYVVSLFVAALDRWVQLVDSSMINPGFINSGD